MNALTVLSLVALAACSSSQLLNYPGIHGYPGLHGYPGVYGYPGFLPGAAPVTLKTVAHTPYTLNTVAPTPLTYNVGPVAPIAPVQTQYHAQDEFGQYSFGYSGGPSSRVESRDAFGNVRGSYNYIDSDGKIQTQHYVADALGFRVSGTNLPVAPEAPVAAPLALPVEDTPEVAAAKVAHQIAYDEAAAAAAAAPARKRRSVVAAHTLGAYSPLRFSYGFSTPLNYGHPAAYGSPLQYTATAGVAPAFGHYAHAGPALNTYAAGAPALTYAAGAPALTYAAGAPALTYAAGAPALTYAAGAPALTGYTAAAAATPRDGTLLRVVNTPNHAVSYRVD